MATMSITCPPCGHVITADDEEQLVRDVQAHAQGEHGQIPSREEVLKDVKRG